MTYCFQCGRVGRPEPATGVDEDGEPACTLHRAKTIQEEKKVAMPDEVTRVCGFENCGKSLIRTNQSGFCTKHFYESKRKGPKVPGRIKPATQVRASLPRDGQASVTVHLTSGQLDRFLLSLPMDAKERMLTAFLAEGWE